jgi:hypothetical protein
MFLFFFQARPQLLLNLFPYIIEFCSQPNLNIQVIYLIPESLKLTQTKFAVFHLGPDI